MADRVHPLPDGQRGVCGRDPAFPLRQWVTRVRGAQTAFADDGAGEVIVLLHGLAGNLTHWRWVAPELAEGARVVAVDLPGCGASEGLPVPATVGRYASHVVALLDRLGVTRATFVGHSLGGMVATHLAGAWPGRVERLVLVNPAGFQPMPIPIAVASRAAMHPGVLRLVLPRMWRALLGQVFRDHNDRTEAFVRTIEANADPSDIHSIASVIGHLRPDFVEGDYTRVLERLVMPIGMIWGDRDRLVAPSVLRRAVAAHGGVCVEELAGVGHMPIIERPEAVVSFVRRVRAA